MPRNAIDYSNTIIYKLCCNDPSITDVYVGHTTNFTRRKQQHKDNCTNDREKNISYNFYVYQFIRDHGGWINWSMVEIEKLSCIDSNDACKHERRYFELLGATLNKYLPYRTQKEYCETNKEGIREKHKEYYENNKEGIREKNKEYYETNKEGIREKQKEYYNKNIDKLKEYSKTYTNEHKVETNEYREKNKDTIKDYNKKYHLANKEKIRERKRLKYFEKKVG